FLVLLVSAMAHAPCGERNACHAHRFAGMAAALPRAPRSAQRFTSPAAVPPASIWPSGENASEVYSAAPSSKVTTNLQVSASHSRTFLSSDAVASVFPSGESAMA